MASNSSSINSANNSHLVGPTPEESKKELIHAELALIWSGADSTVVLQDGEGLRFRAHDWTVELDSGHNLHGG